MFSHIEPYAGDPILSLNEDFQKDPRPNKINLSIGIYFDDAGRIPVLDSGARRRGADAGGRGAKPYLPMEGAANCRARCRRCCSAPTRGAARAAASPPCRRWAPPAA
jgi:aromatic-amino-acid transaminase